MDEERKPPDDRNNLESPAENPSGRKVSRFVVDAEDVREGSPNEAASNNPFFSSPYSGVVLGFDDAQSPLHEKRGVRFVAKLDSSPESTHHDRTWGNMKTMDHPPIMEFYRDSVQEACGPLRPTMAQLIHGKHHPFVEEGFVESFKAPSDNWMASPRKEEEHVNQSQKPAAPSSDRVKFGWVQGVLVRCMLNIFGVMLYLRISWVAGQAGIGLGSVIVLLASVVTLITAISTCAICTNGVVKGGGAYFLISRSLGPEFGGAIGLIFSVANAVGGAMYIVGFAETVRDLMKESGMVIIDGDIWDVRIIGAVTCIILMCIVFIGTEFESKMQMGLLAILLASLVNYAVGSVFPPTEEMQRRGATGYSWNSLVENFLPNFRDEDFFSVFAVYFPAATGIMAGANISGDLADPQRSIPLGTLIAIAVTTVTYLAAVWTTGASNVRDADGYEFPLWNGSVLVQPSCVQNATCPYGLMNYFQVMEMESFWGPLITAGIFAATLSSALASLVSAPKVFQAVCKDKLYPKIGYFAKAYGKNEEPRRAYFLAFVICIAMIGIGDLNAIAPIISNFFLASYALINYACFDQSFADSPGFRPSFKYYNLWVSLAGALLCLFVMFIISWITALITFVSFGLLFLYIHHRNLNVNWGSSAQSHAFKNALNGMVKLSQTEHHVKNFRPQFLVLTGHPECRPLLVDFVNCITKGTCLLVCGFVIPCEPSHEVFGRMREIEQDVNRWLRDQNLRAFYAATVSTSLRSGVQNLLQTTGLGRLRPNIVIVGFKRNWRDSGPTQEALNDLNEYFGTIEDSFDMDLGVCLLRENEGLAGRQMEHSQVDETNKVRESVPSEAISAKRPLLDGANDEREYSIDIEDDAEKENQMTGSDLEAPIEYLRMERIQKAVIDVWWLYDDGGLTLLLPYLLSQPKSYLDGALLRVFTIPTSSRTAAREQASMVALLNKFRIPVSEVKQLPEIAKPPGPETIARWETLIAPWISPDDDCSTGLTTESELASLRSKTNRHLRVMELLEENSSQADLVVLSLPVPRKGFVSASLYMAWLDIMTEKLPRTLLVRGNQSPVLTMYS